MLAQFRLFLNLNQSRVVRLLRVIAGEGSSSVAG